MVSEMTLEEVAFYFEIVAKVSPKSFDFWLNKFFEDLHKEEAAQC